MRPRFIAHLVFASLLLLKSQVYAQSYTYESIDFPGAQNTEAYGINNAGDLVGTYFGGSGAGGWKLSSGLFSTVTMPTSWSGHPWGINDSGLMVGTYGPRTGTEYSAFITDGSTFQTIAHPDAYGTMGLGISNAGTLVGNSDSPDGRRGFVYSNGVLTDISLPDIVIDSMHQAVVGGINSNGTTIVGTYYDMSGMRGFVVRGGNVQFFSYPGSASTSFAGVNDSNQIVGRAFSVNNYVAFVFAQGRFTKIGVPGSQVLETWPTGINNQGQIVGWYEESQGGKHGFLATPTAGTIDSLIAELDSYFAAGAIKNADAYSGLRDKLLAAKASIETGKKRAAILQLEAFQRQLKASNLLLDRVAMQRLMTDAEDLQSALALR